MACLAFFGWSIFTAFVLKLPLHPWCSITGGGSLFVTFFAWSGTSPKTTGLVSRLIGIWNVSIFVAVLAAALFGGVGQPFPKFAMWIALIPTGMLGVAVLICGAHNWLRHLFEKLPSRQVASDGSGCS